MKKPTTRKTDESPEFRVFWEQVWRPYARHTDGRGLAREAFAKHVRNGASPQDIIDGAKCFFRTMKDKDRDYVPLSSTWLNRGSFEDLAITERAHQQRMAEAQQRRVTQMMQESTTTIEKISPERRAEIVAMMKASVNRPESAK